MDDLDKIALGRHHCVDILVGARRLVNYPLVFAAFDARSGGFVIQQTPQTSRCVGNRSRYRNRQGYTLGSGFGCPMFGVHVSRC
jgi:hypothetical protein